MTVLQAGTIKPDKTGKLKPQPEVDESAGDKFLLAVDEAGCIIASTLIEEDAK